MFSALSLPDLDALDPAALKAMIFAQQDHFYLFAGSDNGGERAAAIYSLLGSAKLNGLDPEIYLQHVLERIADHPISKIKDLLPWNVSIESANDQS
jgi:IS66 C-terminal element